MSQAAVPSSQSQQPRRQRQRLLDSFMVSAAPADPPSPSENATIPNEQPQVNGSATVLQEQPSTATPEQEKELQSEFELPVSTTEAEPVAASDSALAPVSASAPVQSKQVFSLFLTPEERKKKSEAEAAAAAGAGTTDSTLNKRGKKPKNKAATTPSTIPTVPKPPSDPKTLVDPNISKTGETHRFFQEAKVSRQQAAELQSESGSRKENQKQYSSKSQEAPFPLKYQQFHGSDAIDAINGVVAQLCELRTSSSRSNTTESPLAKYKKTSGTQSGWYSLRSSPDLGITAPPYTLKPKGRDSWIHWGKDRDQKWREWSERRHRLTKPTDKERQLIHRGPIPAEEYESCQRVAENQQIWQHTWASALLNNAGLTSESTGDTVVDPKAGELWIEKYKPNQGADVLGNRSNTEYLIRWLKGLEVSGWIVNPDEPSAGGLGTTKKVVDIMGTARKRRKRPKRKGELDDFIIYDDADDFEDPYGEFDEEDDGLFAAPKPLSAFGQLAQCDPPAEGDIAGAREMLKGFEIRSNTILLSGPTGSCKTAAVYACAEECGYEVFEVSPGMRRTGKEVLGLVGEMAENHHVHVVSGKVESKDDISNIMGEKRPDSPAPAPGSAPTTAPASTLHSFFQKRQQAPMKEAPKPSIGQDEDESMDEVSDIDVEGSDDHGSPAPHRYNTRRLRSTSRPGSASVKGDEDEESLDKHEDTLSNLCTLLASANPRQSLILLEEVDILFEDDKGFWASIVTLLSKSKRPVVMTCNDVTKIPAGTLRFQEHLEFTRPGLRELHQYLTSVCRIEGFICSSEYIFGLIKHCRYDVRKCLMQLQYDAGVIRSRPEFAGSSSGDVTNNGHNNGAMANGNGKAGGWTMSGNGVGSPVRKKPQRLLRISAKGIIPASAPTHYMNRKLMASPLEELEELEVHSQYTEAMSLCDAQLRMTPKRVFQYYEVDQFEASKDDIVGQQHLAIYKRPSGYDHLLMDQEIAELFEEGCESLYVALTQQQGEIPPYVFEDATKKDDPSRSLADNFVPLNETLFINVQRMQPALEQTLSLQGLRFNLDTTFELYAPLLRSMVHSETMNATVPTGKRAMRSGGHLRRHLDTLSESDRDSILLASLSPPLSRHH